MSIRVDPNLSGELIAGINNNQQQVDVDLQQLSTGKAVNSLGDNPAAAAALVGNDAETAQVDQFQSNISSFPSADLCAWVSPSRIWVRVFVSTTPFLTALAAAVIEITEGNPLFIGEYWRALVESGAVHRAGDPWRRSPSQSAMRVPESICLPARVGRTLERDSASGQRSSKQAPGFERVTVSSPPRERARAAE